MGYRTYIASMPKREYNKIKSMTRQQLIEHYKLKVEPDENYIGMGVYNFGKELFEFGKYTDFKPPKSSLKPFFKDKELNNYFTRDHDFNIVTKEFLAYIIDHYKTRIADYYNELIAPFYNARTKPFERDTPTDLMDSISRDISTNPHFPKITYEDQTALINAIEHIRDMRIEWAVLLPYDLEKCDSVTTSWKYEYAIFELVRVYKTFDWKRNVMIHYGF